MKEYTKFCMPLEDFKEAIKNNLPIEVLTLRKYWSRIGEHVYTWSEHKLEECFKNNNYRLMPNYPKFRLTKGCLADYKKIPNGYLF